MDYERARRRALLNRLLNVLTGRRNSLMSFHEAKSSGTCFGQFHLGMQEVPLSAIVGSIDRTRDFDRDFYPLTTHTRERWERVNRAVSLDLLLPPVSLYKVGEVYFVKDGHHRISVARYRGMGYVDADVTEYRMPGKRLRVDGSGQ